MWVDRRTDDSRLAPALGHEDRRSPKNTRIDQDVDVAVAANGSSGVDAARDLDETHVYVKYTNANDEW